MKKFLVVGIVAVIMTIGFLAVVEAETEKKEYTIIGYGLEQFAVVGDIRQQTNGMVKSWGTKKIARIIVQGFADKKGKTAENEMYALKRAQEMKSFLETKTDAKITALSKGDLEDARKVVVTVEFTVALPPAFKVVLYLSAIVLLILLLNILVDRRSRGKKKKVITQETLGVLGTPSVRATDAVQSTESTTKWIEVDGYSVRIEIDYVDGEKRCYSPFTTASGLKIYEPSESRMISSIRRCLKPDSKFSEQVKDLQEQENGPIKPLK